MKILILGGNGFIGSAVLRRLSDLGHDVTGLGRNLEAAERRFAGVRFVRADLAKMQTPADWADLVSSNEVVVNCAGALQDGLSDDLAAVQERAMLALYAAAKDTGSRLIVQVSAHTDGGAEALPFLATKRHADAALKSCGVDHVILRPALVVGRNAHGGTALLRALASFPFAIPAIHSQSLVATVALDDVVEAVVRAVDGRLVPGSDIELACPEHLTLDTVLLKHRNWLGLSPAPVLEMPVWLATPVTALADAAGRLGWRSPMRSTAMAVMAGGVLSDAASPPPFGLRSLDRTLAENPSGVQDLWFARLYLIKAPLLLTLSLFWLLSGLIPLLRPGEAASHFLPLVPVGLAHALLHLTCALDVGLGLAVLWRPLVRKALVGMLVVTFGYLATATAIEPGLWLDPLGPLVKVIPSVLLSLVALATLEER